MSLRTLQTDFARLLPRLIDQAFALGYEVTLGDEHKITCNELIELAAARAGHALFPADVHNTTSRDLYLLSEAL